MDGQGQAGFTLALDGHPNIRLARTSATIAGQSSAMAIRLDMVVQGAIDDVCILLGSDDVIPTYDYSNDADNTVRPVNAMVSGLNAMVNAIKSARPATNVHVVTLPPITRKDGATVLTGVTDFNARLRSGAVTQAASLFDLNAVISSNSDGPPVSGYMTIEGGALTGMVVHIYWPNAQHVIVDALKAHLGL